MTNFNVMVLMALFVINLTCVNARCPVSCNCTETTSVSCDNVTAIPTNLPTGTTRLEITNSPSLKRISYIPQQLDYLSLSNAGLQTILNDSIAFSNLKTLVMERCNQMKTLDLGTDQLDDSKRQLENLQIRLCNELDEIPGVNNYPLLQHMRISRTNLKHINRDFLSRLTNLVSLDVSHNQELSEIDEYAFQDLHSLNELKMSDCKLPTLYSAYFKSAYINDLHSISTTRNPLQCLEMCQFSQWARANYRFFNIAELGLCFIETGSEKTYYDVSLLTDLEAGCPYTPAGLIIGLTFASIFFVVILGYIVIVAFDIDWQRWFCCRRNDGLNSASAGGEDFWRDRAATATDGPTNLATIYEPTRVEKGFDFDDAGRTTHPTSSSA